MAFNGGLNILGEVGIDGCGRFRGEQRDALGDGAARRGRRMNHRDWLLAVLDHDLCAGADPREQPGEVAGCFRFRDVDHMVRHEVIIALSGHENGWQHRSHPFAKNAKGWGIRCYWMFSVAVVEWFRLPLTPVMVIVRAPLLALRAACTVSVDVPAPVTDVGLKVPVTREPSPLTLKLTVPVNPLTAPIVTV